MEALKKGLAKKLLAHAAWSSFLICATFGAVSPVAAQQRETVEQRPVEQRPWAVTASESELPDSPGSTLAQAQAQQPSTPQASQSQSSSPASSPPQKPVGTAAAEAPSTSGVAASEPAGVAIAPAKQRRARTIVVRTGAIVGAAVAIGAVVALTAATSSKPPGAH